MKRNYLYQELGQVLISVEHCASLHLLEDFLRNRVKTPEDVKGLKTPSSYYGGYTGMRRGPEGGFGPEGKAIIDDSLNKIRDLMEGSHTHGELIELIEKAANQISDEIVQCSKLNDQMQHEVVRYLETIITNMIEELYAE